MESLSSPHWEALTPETYEAFHHVARLPFIRRFYLAGGTGLALHLGHRFSVDLDLFSTDETAVGPDQRDAMRMLLDDPSLSITHDIMVPSLLFGKVLGSAFSVYRYTP